MEGITFTVTLIALLVVLAAIVEASWEVLKLAIPATIPPWADRAAAIIIGVALAWQFQADAPAMIVSQVTEYTYNISWLGIILTGAMISRGANAIHDFFGTLYTLKTRSVKDAEAGL